MCVCAHHFKPTTWAVGTSFWSKSIRSQVRSQVLTTKVQLSWTFFFQCCHNSVFLNGWEQVFGPMNKYFKDVAVQSLPVTASLNFIVFMSFRLESWLLWLFNLMSSEVFWKIGLKKKKTHNVLLLLTQECQVCSFAHYPEMINKNENRGFSLPFPFSHQFWKFVENVENSEIFKSSSWQQLCVFSLKINIFS